MWGCLFLHHLALRFIQIISAATAADFFYILYNKAPHSALATSWSEQAMFALDIQGDSGPTMLLKCQEATKLLES